MYTDREPQPPHPLSPRIRKVLAVATSISLAASGCSDPAKSDLDGTCHPFTVYAQNVWSPIGAAERQLPSLQSVKVASHAGNAIIKVDGWVDTNTPVYPHNPAPWNSGVWFRVADDEHGWVNFAAVRGEKTEPDPTGHGSGGPTAPTPRECEIADPPAIPSQLVSPSGSTTAH